MSVMLSDEKVEELIDEVERRPPLYKKSLKEYSDVNLKKKLWEEVCASIINNWSELTIQERMTTGRVDLFICEFKKKLSCVSRLKKFNVILYYKWHRAFF